MKLLNYFKAGVVISALTAVLMLDTAANAQINDLASVIDYTRNDTQFSINIPTNNEISEYDRFSVMVIKPNKDFNTLNYSTDILYSNALYGSELAQPLASYTFTGSEAVGKYKIRISYTALDGSSITKDYLFPYTGDSKNTIINDFSTTNQTSYEGFWNTHKDSAFDYELYPDLATQAASLGNEFIMMRDGVYEITSINKFESVSEIFECIKKAYAYKSLYNDNEAQAKTNVLNFGIAYDDIYDIKKDFKAYYTLFNQAKLLITDTQSMKTVLKEVAAFANMQNGDTTKTVQQVADAIRNNSTIMGVNLSYASQKNVSLEAVAANINMGNVYELMINPDWFTNLVDSLVQPSTDHEIVTGGQGSGGGGGVRGPSNIGVGTLVLPHNETPVETFSDIGNYEWAKKEIEYLYEVGIISGVTDKTYEPERLIKREEMTKLICVALGLKVTDNKEIKFKDVGLDNWAYPYISLAFSAGIISGRSETEFGVGNYVTREEMAVMLLNALVYKEQSIVVKESDFNDKNSISPWAKTAIDTLSAFGIVNGFEDGSYKPKDGVSRAQAAVVIYRLLEII